MKRLSKDVQISLQSHREIMPWLDGLASDLAREGVTYLGRKLKSSHLLNGLILRLMDMDEAEGLQLAREAVARLEGWAMDREAPAAVKPAASPMGERGLDHPRPAAHPRRADKRSRKQG